MSKGLVIGDLHHREDKPKCFQVPLFFDWLLKEKKAKEYSHIILAGDLVESVFIKHGLLGYYVDLFLNEFKDSKIIIVEGNHDKSLDTNIIDVFKPLKNVEVIDSWKSMVIENTSWLFLPHYDHEGTEKEPMWVAYPKLQFAGEHDFGVHHLVDQTQFGKNVVDVSKLGVKQWLSGHIHTETVTKGGNYLGSPTLNSTSESGKNPLIAEIDFETKKFNLIEVPKFIEYYTVEYPNDLPTKLDTTYGIFTVNESINKQETIKYYEKQAKDRGYTFYSRRINIKKLHEDISLNKEKRQHKISDREYFNEFKIKTTLNSNVVSIIENLL